MVADVGGCWVRLVAIMTSKEIQIDITENAVNVTLNVKPRTRFYALAFFILFVALLFCFVLFTPGNHARPSMWHAMSRSAVGSPGFMYPIYMFLGIALFLFVLQRRYVLYAYPSAETFRCDHSGVTLSRVPWFDTSNTHWRTRTYSIGELEDVRYGVIAISKGASIYGLRFNTGIDAHRVLPGLAPRDAHRILQVLKAFGADVPDDPKLQRKLEEVSG